MFRQTYLEVDCEKLKNNIVEIKKNYSDYNYYFGVVKANAYGHGSYVVNSLIKGGINYLAVSSLEEAITIREYNSEIPILVLEPIRLEYMHICVENNITITVSNVDYFKNLCNTHLSNTLKVHIKLDTGMSRLGIKSSEDLKYIIANIPQNDKLFLEGIYTHFATSGILDKHWDNQLSNFKKITKDVDLSTIPIVHMGRSLTLVNHEKIPFCNGIRLGIIMYGMSQSMPKSSGIKAFLRDFRNNRRKKKLNISSTTTTNNLNLQTAITLYSEVINLSKIHQNDFVGYGASYVSNGDEIIATIPVGYADGVSGKIKHVVINDKKYNVVGQICMDMLTVKVDNTVKLGDKVTVLGGDQLPIKTVASECGINSYTLFTGITNRVPRVYKDGESCIEIKY